MTDMPVGERKQLAPPVDDSGPFGWARKHLFSSWGNGITTVVLLTTTAEDYFPRFGFERTDRSVVPEEVRESAEFRGACPASATVMQLVL